MNLNAYVSTELPESEFHRRVEMIAGSKNGTGQDSCVEQDIITSIASNLAGSSDPEAVVWNDNGLGYISENGIACFNHDSCLYASCKDVAADAIQFLEQVYQEYQDPQDDETIATIKYYNDRN